MATALEMIKELLDNKGRVVAAQRELHATIEGGQDPNGEAQASFDKMNTELDQIDQRVNNLTSMVEAEKHANEQRDRFAKLVVPDQDQERETFADKMRTWLKASLPDAEVWAPRAIKFNLGSVGVDMAERNAMAFGAPERHDLTKGGSTAGAELIPTGFVRTLYQHLIEFAGIRQTNAEILRTNSGENMLVPKTTGYGTAAIVSEAGAFAESDAAFAQVTVGAYKYGQLIQVSRELIEDSAIDILAFVAKAAGIAIGVANGAHLVTGTGTGQPQGITASGTAGVTGATGQTLTVTAADLINLYHSIVSGYRRNAYWVLNDASVAKIRLLRDDSGASAGTGNYLWQPGLQAGVPDTLLGKPVVTDPTMPVMAANALSIGFGDFSLYYVIRDVDGVRFERSDDFAFANDLVTFRSVFRTDARQLVNGAAGAVKFYKNSAT